MPASASLFRTVQEEELKDITSFGGFRTVANSMEGKLFWTTRDDAERLDRLWMRQEIGPSSIVEVRVPPAVLSELLHLRVDQRPARFVDEDQLDWFNGSLMELVLPPTATQGGRDV